VLLVLCYTVLGQNPSPPNLWPLTWHSWVVTTVKMAAAKEPTFNEGRLIMFDTPNKVACRYWEQNLVNVSTTRRADYCDYDTNKHYTMLDTKPDSKCSNVSNVVDTISRLVFPADFVGTARYLGNNTVGQLNCNHFYAPAVKLGDGSFVQMDVWVDMIRGLPCQISTLDLQTQLIITWAFDGFDITIPHQAIQQCSIPKIMCAQQNWVCQAKRNADEGALAAAIGWVCGQGGVNCAPINPGGDHFYPDTLIAHCDWAFNEYFLEHRYNQGIDACNFNNLAELVPPTPPSPPPPVVNNSRPTSIIEFLAGMTGTYRIGSSGFAMVFPFDLACANEPS